MLAAIEAGYGTLQQMSARVSLKHRLWLSGSPTLRVSLVQSWGLSTANASRRQSVQRRIHQSTAGERETVQLLGSTEASTTALPQSSHAVIAPSSTSIVHLHLHLHLPPPSSNPCQPFSVLGDDMLHSCPALMTPKHTPISTMCEKHNR